MSRIRSAPCIALFTPRSSQPAPSEWSSSAILENPETSAKMTTASHLLSFGSSMSRSTAFRPKFSRTCLTTVSGTKRASSSSCAFSCSLPVSSLSTLRRFQESTRLITPLAGTASLEGSRDEPSVSVWNSSSFMCMSMSAVMLRRRCRLLFFPPLGFSSTPSVVLVLESTAPASLAYLVGSNALGVSEFPSGSGEMPPWRAKPLRGSVCDPSGGEDVSPDGVPRPLALSSAA
mmetsp:Transcript_31007/g.101073  ORF Transcript_31007/g.101073 Transcript_31007/m.101073 type:complete len:232 (-) Transcript_31007:351-1046(-)